MIHYACYARRWFPLRGIWGLRGTWEASWHLGSVMAEPSFDSLAGTGRTQSHFEAAATEI